MGEGEGTIQGDEAGVMLGERSLFVESVLVPESPGELHGDGVLTEAWSEFSTARTPASGSSCQAVPSEMKRNFVNLRLRMSE